MAGKLGKDDLGPVQVVADRLMALYPDENSLRRVLALAKVDATRIPFDGRAANASWFAAVEASRQGRLGALVGVMLEEYPLDPWLVALYAILTKSRQKYKTTSAIQGRRDKTEEGAG